MSVAVPPPRGEQRRQRRREAMLEAARSLFLERGYDAVTLSEIVRRSGGSLSTLYELFENKAGLLGAIVGDERFEGIERLDAIAACGASPAETLAFVAASIQCDLTAPGVIGLMRIVMAESLRNAAFAVQIYDNAHLPRVEWLARLFAGWTTAGRARIVDPAMAAHLFMGLILHAAQTQALFCGATVAPTSPPHDYLPEAVRLFVTGYAVACEAATAEP